MSNCRIAPATLLAAAAVVVAATAACSAEGTDTAVGSGEPSGAAGNAVAVTLSEWSVESSVDEAAAGDITFEVTNAGSLAHNFVVFETELPPDQLPVENAQVVESDAVREAGRIDEFASGSSESVRLTLDAGPFVLVCNVPGHYQQGMRASLSVAP